MGCRSSKQAEEPREEAAWSATWSAPKAAEPLETCAAPPYRPHARLRNDTEMLTMEIPCDTICGVSHATLEDGSVVVSVVHIGSVAEAAGLRVGHQIVAVDGERVLIHTDVGRLVQKGRDASNSTVTLEIFDRTHMITKSEGGTSMLLVLPPTKDVEIKKEVAHGGDTIVATVARVPDSLKTSLNVGDTICAVNGTPVNALTWPLTTVMYSLEIDHNDNNDDDVDVDKWVVRAERERLKKAWTYRNVEACYPGLIKYKWPEATTYISGCVKSLMETRDEAPESEADFTEALLKLIKGREATVCKDLDECRLLNGLRTRANSTPLQ